MMQNRTFFAGIATETLKRLAMSTTLLLQAVKLSGAWCPRHAAKGISQDLK